MDKHDRYYMQISNHSPLRKSPSFSIRDKDRYGPYGPKPVAWAYDELTGGKILKMLNDEARAERACCCRCRCQS